MVKVVVIDGNVLYRKGVVSAISEHPELRVVGDVSDCGQVLSESHESSPDIIIMDAFSNGHDGVDSMPTLMEKFPQVKVIVMSSSSREADFLKAMRAGVRGYLLKTAGPMEVIECIRIVFNSDIIVTPSKAVGLFERFGESGVTDRDRGSRLSPRETEVLKLVALGSSNKQIASECFVSETTVKAHLRKILSKLSVKNRAEAVAQATVQGLLA